MASKTSTRKAATPASGSRPPKPIQVEAVLRFIRGVDPAEISEELGVTTTDLEQWRDEFIAAGLSGLEVTGAGEAADGPAAVESSAPSWREQASRRAHTNLQTRDAAAGGLRERKKARTRATIRKHAMRLFHEQGYAETTVNQIADAAEVSPSTFFRYFATKEDVVFQDDAEAELTELFDAVPAEYGPVKAVFRGLLDAMASTSEADAVRQQVILCLSVPELRAVLFDNLTQLMNEIAELVGKRVGRSPDDFEVRTFSAAVQGVWYSVLFDWAENPSTDLETAMMQAAEQLERGLPL